MARLTTCCVFCGFAAISLWFCGGCSSRATPHTGKIDFDYTTLDEHGLRGNADGKVSVSYEFAIPNTDVCRTQILAIDPAIVFMPGSRGRIGALPSQCLCIGSTNHPHYRKILTSLAALGYITRISECHWE